MPGVADSSPASTTMDKKGGETPPFCIPGSRVVLRSMVSPSCYGVVVLPLCCDPRCVCGAT
jgi:hypothetical protein